MTANERRAERFGEILPGYSGEDEYSNLIDLLTDACHFARCEGYHLGELLDTVERHYRSETGEDLPFWSVESLPVEVSDAVSRVVDYLWRDEAADYRQTPSKEGRAGHVFRSLRVVRRWLGRQETRTVKKACGVVSCRARLGTFSAFPAVSAAGRLGHLRGRGQR